MCGFLYIWRVFGSPSDTKLWWSIGRTDCLHYSTRVDLYCHQILLPPNCQNDDQGLTGEAGQDTEESAQQPSERSLIRELERKMAVMETALFHHNAGQVPRSRESSSTINPSSITQTQGTQSNHLLGDVGFEASQTMPVDRMLDQSSGGNQWGLSARSNHPTGLNQPVVTYSDPSRYLTNGFRSGDASRMRPSRTSSGYSTMAEPRMRVPEYRGTEEWEAFYMQFTTMARSYGWDNSIQLQQLIFSMRGDALTYVSQLPLSVQQDLVALTAALGKRFGDHILPETHRHHLLICASSPRRVWASMRPEWGGWWQKRTQVWRELQCFNHWRLNTWWPVYQIQTWHLTFWWRSPLQWVKPSTSLSGMNAVGLHKRGRIQLDRFNHQSWRGVLVIQVTSALWLDHTRERLM